jgi:thiamine-monophosphate kinase
MASEFDLIRQYFTRPTTHTNLGVGDDAALLTTDPGHELAISVDMLVAGTHFLADTDPRQLGWKSLAVNISDMAAMGAEPKWATLAIALPAANEDWIAAFAEGFFACAERFKVDLIGGDTTRGPLCISVQIMGQVPTNQALRRDGAKAGDDIWVSGQLGDAALALNHLLNKYRLTDDELTLTLPALLQPQPRVALGLSLRNIAHSAIDISDGLLADLGHMLKASGLGAELCLDDIPRSAIMQQHLTNPSALNMLLAGGDDYELCFTAPADTYHRIKQIAQDLGLALSCIGKTNTEHGLLVHDRQGDLIETGASGFDHFRQ